MIIYQTADIFFQWAVTHICTEIYSKEITARQQNISFIIRLKLPTNDGRFARRSVRLSTKSLHLHAKAFDLECLRNDLIPKYTRVGHDIRYSWRTTTTHLRGVRRVRKLRCDVQHEALHDINLLVSNLHFQSTATFDEVLLQHVVKSWVHFFAHILDE